MLGFLKLAELVRIVRTGCVLALATLAVLVVALSGSSTTPDASREPVERSTPAQRDSVICRRAQPPPSKDTLFVVLREAPERIDADEESDWARSYHMVWDGPIRTWTTMRKVRVPGLDHRMIESIEPVGTERNVVFVHVRVVVPGDLEAALAWVQTRPEVDRASIAYDYGQWRRQPGRVR